MNSSGQSKGGKSGVTPGESRKDSKSGASQLDESGHSSRGHAGLGTKGPKPSFRRVGSLSKAAGSFSASAASGSNLSFGSKGPHRLSYRGASSRRTSFSIDQSEKYGDPGSERPSLKGQPSAFCSPRPSFGYGPYPFGSKRSTFAYTEEDFDEPVRRSSIAETRVCYGYARKLIARFKRDEEVDAERTMRQKLQQVFRAVYASRRAVMRVTRFTGEWLEQVRDRNAAKEVAMAAELDDTWGVLTGDVFNDPNQDVAVQDMQVLLGDLKASDKRHQETAERLKAQTGQMQDSFSALMSAQSDKLASIQAMRAQMSEATSFVNCAQFKRFLSSPRTKRQSTRLVPHGQMGISRTSSRGSSMGNSRSSSNACTRSPSTIQLIEHIQNVAGKDVTSPKLELGSKAASPSSRKSPMYEALDLSVSSRTSRASTPFADRGERRRGNPGAVGRTRSLPEVAPSFLGTFTLHIPDFEPGSDSDAGSEVAKDAFEIMSFSSKDHSARPSVQVAAAETPPEDEGRVAGKFEQVDEDSDAEDGAPEPAVDPAPAASAEEPAPPPPGEGEQAAENAEDGASSTSAVSDLGNHDNPLEWIQVATAALRDIIGHRRNSAAGKLERLPAAEREADTADSWFSLMPDGPQSAPSAQSSMRMRRNSALTAGAALHKTIDAPHARATLEPLPVQVMPTPRRRSLVTEIEDVRQKKRTLQPLRRRESGHAFPGITARSHDSSNVSSTAATNLELAAARPVLAPIAPKSEARKRCSVEDVPRPGVGRRRSLGRLTQ